MHNKFQATISYIESFYIEISKEITKNIKPKAKSKVFYVHIEVLICSLVKHSS